MLDDRLIHQLKEAERKLDSQGKLHSRTQLEAFYGNFRSRFGPERLRRLDGEELLSTMHDHGRRDDSLVYWLEFKDDEDFPALFGSIAGGSALKFGIYRRKETGEWMTGSPQNQQTLSLTEAIQIARQHRDQLLRGVELLEKLPANGGDADYLRLQERLDAEAPDVSDTAWGHKYWSLLSPGKLDDFHNANWQRFFVMKLLQVPPEHAGRYVCAGRFAAAANALGWHMNTLTTVLKQLHGSPHGYWRVGTSDGNEPAKFWPAMRDGGYVAIGWPDLGNLSETTFDKEGKERIKALMQKNYGGLPQHAGKAAKQVFNFVAGLAEGDFVLAAQGMRILGVGRVTGGYSYDPEAEFPHHRPVEWLSLAEFTLPQSGEGLQTSFFPLEKPENLVAIERHVLGAAKPPGNPPNLPGVQGRIQAVLERKGQIILYGPPGTGKTHLAEQTVRNLAALAAFGAAYKELDAEQQAAITQGTREDGPLVRMCSFHPAYGYEEFLEGYRPEADGAQMRFVLREGIFKRLCADAQRRPHLRFYLIIDEINRGDIPRIMGELLTVMERSKRGKPILLPMSGTPFQVPENVYLVGTMNTADRSIALLDTALRRRFGFLELMPDYELLGGSMVGGIPLGPWLKALNARICEHVGRDGRNLQIGHAYLMDREKPLTDFQRLSRVVQEELIPLLEEYCYEDWDALERILGSSLVEGREKRIRHELFESARQQELVQALLKPSPEIVSSASAVASEASTQELEDDDTGAEPEGA